METQFGLDYSSVFTVLSEFVDNGLVVINSSGEMDFASGKARELLGCGDDLNASSCHPDVRGALEKIIQDVREGDVRSHQQEVRYEVDGEMRNVVLEAHPIDEKDCTGVLLIVKNADSMRKMALDLQMAAQLRNTRRLYKAVVDDLKQPLTAVMVHLDLLRDLVAGEEDDEEPVPALKSLRIIKRQVVDLSRALTLLLEEIQPAETEERGFSLRDVLDDVKRLVEPQAEQQDVGISLNVSSHSARMNGSRQRVKQAILNVAVNALDAMPDGGRLNLRLNVDDRQAVIAVADSGSGIPEKVLPHIFEMHYTTKDSGTGGGLYVARDVIERHGGSIDVDTEEGHGTTFRVLLPVSENGS